eukprot:scaffold14373_cov27-Phaeocystis_antarctica.AAC.4
MPGFSSQDPLEGKSGASSRGNSSSNSYCRCLAYCRLPAPGLNCPGQGVGEVTLSKLECSKQAYALNTLAWDNTIGLWPILLVCRTGVMIKRDSRGHSYFIVRGIDGRAPPGVEPAA